MVKRLNWLMIVLLVSMGGMAQSVGKQYNSYKGLVMAGYQGWFNSPDDGAGRKWHHYSGRDGFYPGSCSIDLWPDVSEYTQLYKTPFTFADGKPATVFSSYNESTVNLHFKWMKEYGLDGVFMQRFITEIRNESGLKHFNKVLNSAMKAASQYERAICVMYDLSGMRPGDEQILLKDIAEVSDRYSLKNRTKNPSYLYHNGKPLVTVWGVGFNDNRSYGFKEARQIIDGLKSQGFSVMLGVPTQWRELKEDTEPDPQLHELIRKCDIVMPWLVGRYNETNYPRYQKLVEEDIKWAKTNNVDYVPLVFPGFSWGNMKGQEHRSFIPRNKGSFLWKQLMGSIQAGAEMIYVAMFDELDEGTAIFKCARRVPVGKSVFVPIEEEVESDHYLKLVGEAAKILRKENFPFRNPELTVEQRVEDLVSSLTLEEKVKQMLNSTPAVERLGIPTYNWWNECLHGIGRTNYHVTVFPQAIGMAAAWNDALIKEVASSIADEGRAIYNDAQLKGDYSQYHALTYWTPNVNIFRDPRWGRGQETYGEDPCLTSKIGKAFVLGLQGDNPRYLKASACAKHYAVHSGPEKGRHSFNSDVSTYDLWETYLPAFRTLVTDAKVSGVMCAYNAYQGQPCCGNDLLMRSILRNKWNFTGYVTSDCGAIDDFFNHHKTHPDATSAATDAVFHGTDLDCGQSAYLALVKAVKEGVITEKQLDVSVKRLFTIRFRLGMFDPIERVEYARIPISVLECQKHQDLAKRLARESMVLLKNDKLLPLQKSKMKKIVVMGPNADHKEVLLGNYNGNPSYMLTPLQAIRERLGNQAEVIYIKGIDYVDTVSESNLIQYVDQAKSADAVIFVGGISPQLEGEEMPVSKDGFSGGDRTTIVLPVIQTRIMKALVAAKIPTVFVMMTGSAIAIPWEAEHVPAILNAWYGGQYGGEAITDVLFGDYNPSGKLPVTFYAKDGDLPDFESYDMQGRTYRYFKGKALYPFGYGLSYTRFTYSSLKLPKTCRTTDKEIQVIVEVKNVGKLDGDEVVQLYISHPDKKILTPITSLKGFKRISLRAGESQQLTFSLTSEDLACVDENGIRKVLPGAVRIQVGGVSPVVSLATPMKWVENRMEIEGDLYTIDQ